MGALLDAALDLAARGGHVLPIWPAADGRCTCGVATCRAPGKHPLGVLVPRGLADATRDAALIRDWWARRPDASLGLAMTASGWLALDVDLYHGDLDRLRALVAELGDLPDTVLQRSGSGQGFHVVFHAPDFRPRGLIGGIVVRAAAFIVVAPSVHVSGGRYAWAPGCAPGEAPVAELPPAWLAALRPDASAGRAGLPPAEPAWLAAIPPAVRIAAMRRHLEGERGEVAGVDRAGMTFDVARTAARGFAIRDPEVVLAALAELYNPRCKPPWDSGRLARKVAQAYTAATEPTWGDSLLALRLIGWLGGGQ